MNKALAIAAAVVLVLLGGAFLLGDREPPAASAPAPLTTLAWPPYSSAGPSSRPNPYPTVPSSQIDGDHGTRMLTAKDGTRLLIPALETDCSREEVWLLGEYPDRVELELRWITKPVPPSISVAPDGSYGCASAVPMNRPHAAIDLRSPLGERRVVITRKIG